MGVSRENDGKQEWPHPNTATMIGYMLKMEWKTPFLRRLRSINTQWKMAIDCMDTNFFVFISCCQGEAQPRNSHTLGLFRNGRLIHYNLKAYGKHSREAEWALEHIPDREIEPSGAHMLNNLQLTQSSLSTQSPLRDSLIHLTLSGCHSINKSAIDILIRLSNSHLPKLQRIDMVELRLELCQ